MINHWNVGSFLTVFRQLSLLSCCRTGCFIYLQLQYYTHYKKTEKYIKFQLLFQEYMYCTWLGLTKLNLIRKLKVNNIYIKCNFFVTVFCIAFYGKSVLLVGSIPYVLWVQIIRHVVHFGSLLDFLKLIVHKIFLVRFLI